MKSSRNGKNILVSVENISPYGLWLFVKGKEYFLSYDNFPYFENQTLKSIQKIKLLHGSHLYWPDLDVDLEIDNLEHPEKYPLISRKTIKLPHKSDSAQRQSSNYNVHRGAAAFAV